ncbi:hypothetical protein ABZW58_20775 [Streptomyces cellulosae]
MSPDRKDEPSRFAHDPDSTDGSGPRPDVPGPQDLTGTQVFPADPLVDGERPDDGPGLWERLGDPRATAVTAAVAGAVLLGALLVMAMVTDSVTFTSDETRPAGGSSPVVAPSDSGSPGGAVPADPSPTPERTTPEAPPATESSSAAAPPASARPGTSASEDDDDDDELHDPDDDDPDDDDPDDDDDDDDDDDPDDDHT